MADKTERNEAPGPSQSETIFQLIPQSNVERKEQVNWVPENLQTDQPVNQMRIVGLQNESLGNITLTHEQFSALIANKSDSGVVTLQLPSDEGVMTPMELQIVPEDSLYNAEPQKEVQDNSTKEQPPQLSKEDDSETKITPILQLPQSELIYLTNQHIPIKSLVFRQVKTAEQRPTNGSCLTDPKFAPFIRRKTYVDLSKEDYLSKESIYKPRKLRSVAKCNQCEKSFTNAANLKRHILNIHIGQQRQHRCEHCHKEYSRRDYLLQHIKTVHDNTKYNCKQCPKGFTQLGSLTRHVEAIHMNVKRYSCKHCSYAASSAHDLKKHAASRHFKQTRYECAVCKFAAWSAAVVKKHIEVMHGLKGEQRDQRIVNRKSAPAVAVPISRGEWESDVVDVVSCEFEAEEMNPLGSLVSMLNDGYMSGEEQVVECHTVTETEEIM